MTYRLFQYPLPAPPELEDLNAFLASHRVAAVTQHLVQATGGAMLLFIVQTVPGDAVGKNRQPEAKIDYREVLNAEKISFVRGAIREVELQSRAASLFAHARFGDDGAWRQMVASFSRIGDAPEPASRPAWRVVEQPGEELPLREPQQEHARQSEQEHRLSGLSGSRHDDIVSTDDAHSRAPLPQRGGDETTGKTPLPTDIRPSSEAVEKAGGGAPEAPTP